MTTALTLIDLHRTYLGYATPSDFFSADELLRIEGFLRRQARRWVTLAGIAHFFARTQQVPTEFCSWDTDDEVIRPTRRSNLDR